MSHSAESFLIVISAAIPCFIFLWIVKVIGPCTFGFHKFKPCDKVYNGGGQKLVPCKGERFIHVCSREREYGKCNKWKWMNTR